MEHTSHLRSLAAKLQHLIIQSLDPIGLISLSQTGRFYHQLINPSRTEQIERLLALECLPKYGGDRPAILHPDSDEVVAGPDWQRDAWPEHHRWACAFCLRLLPHTHFDNHALLRRRYRKPGPGSPEATPLTSWQPGSGRGAAQNARRRHQQRQAAVAGAGNDPPGDSRQLGWARTRRKCNECMFQRGELGHMEHGRYFIYIRPHGTPEVPIQISRRVVFRSVLDRYFPELEASLESGPRPFPLRRNTARVDIREETWTMYMVRCPGCQRWQEQRAFGIGDCSKHWKPMVDLTGRLRRYNDQRTEDPPPVMLDEVRCNGCFVREHGRHALGRELIRFFRRVIRDMLLETQFQLGRPWFWSFDTFRSVPKQYIKELREMKNKAWYGAIRGKYAGTQVGFITHGDVATLTTVHEEFKSLWTVMRTQADFVGEDLLENAHFMAWFNCYHEYEAIWKWLRKVLSEVESNPDTLVAWALARDGAWLT